MKYFFVVFICFGLLSCGKDQMGTDNDLIKMYLLENNLNALEFESGLHVVIINQGGEEKPSLLNEVEVHYEGRYLDGEKFDSSYDAGNPVKFPLSVLIAGWQEGIPMFGRGGEGTLLVPSHLGYGSNPPNGIRKDAVLVFDIELLDFN